MKCEDCGKPYMTGLIFIIKGSYIRCQSCYDKVIEERKRCTTVIDEHCSKINSKKHLGD